MIGNVEDVIFPNADFALDCEFAALTNINLLGLKAPSL